MTAPDPDRGTAQAYHVGSNVWIPVLEVGHGTTVDGSKRKTTQWHRGVVESLSRQSGQLVLDVACEDGARRSTPESAACMQNERDDTVDDLTRSDFLHEPGILHTLDVRYGLDAMYTYSGQILIAVNPHKRLRGIYGPRMMGNYRGAALGALSPHIYAIAEQAYAAMMMDAQPQAILISGESGAGKTESAKLVMQYLAHRALPGPKPGLAHVLAPLGSLPQSSGGSGSGGALPSRAGDSPAAPIEEQVLESNPLLEAFGNAKTARNDNSSRFGKYVQIEFDAAGRIVGAAISTYLLERSRVVGVKSPERSYHIFYQVCAGASPELRAALGLEGGAASFRYLARSEALTLADVDDGEALAATLEAMRVVGLGEPEVEAVLRIVAAVLHLGNLAFEDGEADEARLAGGAEGSLDVAARLLRVDPRALLLALTQRAISTGRERIDKALSAEAAAESRDALAKTLYARTFDWLVRAVNRKMGSLGEADGGEEEGVAAPGGAVRSVAILDIYGFESFEANGFEQLCINLANEKLQQQFNAHVFKGEQAEYAQEGIAWSFVDFFDNQDVLELLEGGGRDLPGVFPLLDEACRLPRATAQDLAHALRTRLAGHACFGAPKRSPSSFSVRHYAGAVCYGSEELVDKNRDFVVAEHAELLRRSGCLLLRELFAESGGGGAAKSAFQLSSVGARFRRQLGGLMASLNACSPHYIRCIKPNARSDPGRFSAPYVLDQLRAGGVLEAVRIASAGFPTRKPFHQFAQRYALLLRPEAGADVAAALAGLPRLPSGCADWYAMPPERAADLCRLLLSRAALSDWQLGRSRVFLRAGQLAQLEGERARALAARASRLQAAWRAWRARRAFLALRAAALLAQRRWRGARGRREALERRRERAAATLQKHWRARLARREAAALRAAERLRRLERAAVAAQARWRGRQARAAFARETELGARRAEAAQERARRERAAAALQAAWRRLQARRRLAALRARAERERELREALEEALAGRRAAEERAGDLERALAGAAGAEARAGEAEAARREALAARAERARAEEALAARAEAGAGLEREARAARARAAAAEARAAEAEAEAGRLGARAAALAESLGASQARAAEAERARLAEAERAAEGARGAAAGAAEEAERWTARVAALGARVERLEAELAAAAAREAGLRAELERRGGAASRGAEEEGPRAGGGAKAAGPPTSPDGAGLTPARQADVEALCQSSVAAKLEPVAVELGGLGSLRIPLASWLVCECFIAWAGDWPAPALAAASARLQAGVLGSAQGGGLRAHAYWLSASLAAGALLKMRTIGRREGAVLLRLGDELIACAGLHESLGGAVAAELPVDAAALLSADMQRSARRWPGGGSPARWRPGGRGGGSDGAKDEGAPSSPAFNPALGSFAPLASPAAPAAAAAAPGPPGPSAAWQALCGGLANVVEALREGGVPAPAVRAVAAAALRWVDGELLNALLLRRDCCSVSAVRALQAGLADVLAWVAYLGPAWCCEAEQAEQALARASQAARYLVQGKEDCVRKAFRGVDVLADLGRLCPALTLPQICRLTEHQHDDWIAGAAGAANGSIVLLEALRRLQTRRAGGGGEDEEDDEEDLLVEPAEAFALPRKALTEAARCFVQVPVPEGGGGPGKLPPSGLALLDLIAQTCRQAGIPQELRADPAFAFLSAAL